MTSLVTLSVKAAPTAQPSKKVAIFIKKINGWQGNAELYQMCPAFQTFEYVILSSVDLVTDFGLSETMMFGSNQQGETNFDNILRFNPAKTHRSALFSIDYTII